MTVRTVTVLGSTGSIGRQALDVIARHPEHFRVAGLAAGSNVAALCAQARRHAPAWVAVADPAAAARVGSELGDDVRVLSGDAGVVELAARGADVVLNGMVGSRGLRPTLAALQSGARVALANKESLILGGRLVLEAAAEGQIVPVDSEHSALAQCLRAGSKSEVDRLVVTASGGPFRGRTREQLRTVTVRDALAHPTWEMGAVITVNSATLANKGLEVIEAHLLFDLAYDRIDVVVHPQSIVHSMVTFRDGSTIAQLSPPDMRLPIQLALGWPDRLDDAVTSMDWSSAPTLTFEPVAADVFGMLRLAVAAGRDGGTSPGVYNAANEEAVAAFLEERISFLGIEKVVAAVLEEHTVVSEPDLGAVLDAERWARRRAAALVTEGGLGCSS